MLGERVSALLRGAGLGGFLDEVHIAAEPLGHGAGHHLGHDLAGHAAGLEDAAEVDGAG